MTNPPFDSAQGKQTPTRKPDGTVSIHLILPQSSVAQSYQAVLDQVTQETEVKGFRKGKAPRNAVETHVGTSTLYQKVLERELPKLLSTAIKTHNLKPISDPRVIPEALPEKGDWHFILEVVEFPQFTLGNYKDEIRGALKMTTMWLPGQEKTKEEKETGKESLSDKRLKKVFDTLLDKIDVPLAPILVEEEANRALSRLLEQMQKLGLTLEQYVHSLGKTVATLKTEYQATAKANLKLELILQKIAQEESIAVSEKEVDEMIAAVPDEKTREAFQKDPHQRIYIQSVLKKRKVIDFLLKLG